MLRDRAKNSTRSTGLVKKIIDTLVQRVVANLGLMAGGDHQHRNFLATRQRPKSSYKLQAIHGGHHVVDQNQVGFLALAPLQSPDGVSELKTLAVRQMAYQGTQHCNVDRVVVDDRHLHDRTPFLERVLRAANPQPSVLTPGRTFRPDLCMGVIGLRRGFLRTDGSQRSPSKVATPTAASGFDAPDMLGTVQETVGLAHDPAGQIVQAGCADFSSRQGGPDGVEVF